MNPVADFDLKLVHAFDVRLNFRRRLVFGPVSGGARQGYVALEDGIVRGPRLNGRVMEASGADWGVLRTDGVLEANAHYMLEADDGTPIYIHNRGYIYNTQPGAAGPAYFRCTPYFRAPVGPHDWLNRTVVVGGGERFQDPDHTIFRYYTVE
ncbi:MAG TPA: DUF3237 domain-containing protein [Steroidobacteraceae bacterium]|nr:DUF3237 domain-containing protein [Steroidobacteraceae bacterium]